jgi:hypothetical protein
MSKQLPTGLCYVATPYSKYPGGIEAAFLDACKLTAKLIQMGISCFSSIAHTHPIAVHGGLDPYDYSIWIPADLPMMQACETLIVVHMQGWQESLGIGEEVKFFAGAGKPIFDLNPQTMELRERVRVRPIRERYEGAAEHELRHAANAYLHGWDE